MDLRELLKQVARDCNREADAPAIIKSIVEDNWLDSIDALANLGPDEWAQLKLPIKFVLLLRAKLAELHPATPSAPQPVARPAAPPERGEVVPMGQPPKSEEWADIDLAVALELIVAGAPALPAALRLLQKIVANCLNNPEDMSKRQLRLSNDTLATKVFGVPGGLEFLNGIGFVQAGEQLVLKTLYKERLEYAASLLLTEQRRFEALVTPRAALASGMLKFDPFKSSHVSQGSAPVPKDAVDHDDYSPEKLKEAIGRELALRESGGHKESVELNPKYYPPGVTKASRSPPVGNGDDERDEGSRGPALDESALSRLKEIMTGNVKFRSVMSQQLAALRKVPIFREARIVLVAPDRSSVEVTIRTDTTMSAVYDLVWHQLLAPNIKKELRTAEDYWLGDPPLRPRLPCDETTVFRLGLVPTGHLRIMSRLTGGRGCLWLREFF